MALWSMTEMWHCQQSSTFPRTRRITAVLAGSLVLACATQFLMGQGGTPYAQFPYLPGLLVVDPTTGTQKVDEKKVKALQQFKTNVLNGSLAYAENATNFKKWYTHYQFAAFSQIDQLQKLPERRKELLDDLRRARSKEVRDPLLALIYNGMTNVFLNPQHNVHPAVRYNAMLLIGDLNAEEVAPPNRFPAPYGPALPFLVDQYRTRNQTDALRLAALIGIMRHVQLDWTRPPASRIPAAKKQELTNLMLATISAQKPPPQSTKEGFVWLQRRAMDVLGALGVVGTNDAANKAISALVRNPDADLALRLSAAAALARIPAPDPSKPTVKLTIAPATAAADSRYLGALLVVAVQKDFARLEEMQKKSQYGMDMYGMSSGMGMPGEYSDGAMPGDYGSMPGMDSAYGAETMDMSGGYGYGGYGMTAGPKDPQTELFRRRIKFEVQCIEQGLAGLKRAVPQKSLESDSIDRIATEVASIKKATDPPPMVNTAPMFQKSVKDSMLKLETIVASLLPKNGAASPAAESPQPAPAAAPGPVSDEPGLPVAAVQTASNPAAGKGAAPSKPVPAAGRPAASVPGPAARVPRK
jgi:hypothetical protein